MSPTIKEVFDKHFAKVKFDTRLSKALYQYQISYLNSSKEYLEFYGGNLLGVQVVRFKDSDVAKFFDVLDIDYYALTEDIKHIKSINQDFKISSDTFNITSFYLIHRFLTAPLLNDTLRQRAAYDCGVLFFYRCTAALLSYYFKYPTDPHIAQAAYANLSNKYLIKKLGSWHKVMDYRATEVISKDGVHYKNLITFKDDGLVVYAMNDSQSRVKDLIKNYAREFYNVRDEGVKIGTTGSTFLDIEGEEVLKEKTRSVESYISYIRNIIHDQHSFVKDELITVICHINTNTSFRMTRSSLAWISEHYSDQKFNKDIDEFISTVIIHSFYLLQDNETVINLRDYPTLLVNLKNLYLSTRSTDRDLSRIRDLGGKLIRANNGSKLSPGLVLATRTAVILYIILRTLIGKNMQ